MNNWGFLNLIKLYLAFSFFICIGCSFKRDTKSTDSNSIVKNISNSIGSESNNSSNSTTSEVERVEDFFLLSKGMNTSVRQFFNDKGEKVPWTQTTYFSVLSPNSFKTIEIDSAVEEVKIKLNDDQDVKTYSTYSILNNELLLIEEDYLNIKKGKRERTTYVPPQIVLKIPNGSNIEKWKYTTLAGDEYNCYAQFTNVEKNGKQSKAIKLTKQITRDDAKWANSITFFVKGFGEWKLYSESEGKVLYVVNQFFSAQSNQISSSEFDANTIISASSENMPTNGNLFQVIVDKAFFYNEPNIATKRRGYLVNGEQFFGQRTENGFVYTEFTNARGTISKGWVLISDVIKQ